MITVGALDANNNVSIYSSYGAESVLNIRKPTISAPGTKMQTAYYGSGTSFAAPVVAGVVAKILQEFPYLISYPEVMVSSLITSAMPVNGQLISSWDIHAGAGRINYEKAREAIRNNMSFSNSTKAGSAVRSTKTINVSTNKRIKIAAMWFSNSTTTNSTSKVQSNIHTDYDLRIRNTSGSIIASSNGITNIEYISYNNSAYTQLIIEIYQYGNKKTDIMDWGSVTWCYS